MYEHEVRVYVPDGDVQTFDYDTENHKALDLVRSIELNGYVSDKKNVYAAEVDQNSTFTSDPVAVAIEYYFEKKV
ncbi:hypothetical protein [Rhodococcus sp. JG-3]|uniref:hypothetical protein n=1 Tax=Rhodococcus sp. JG-3 TaxID=1305835 RepID=UPI0004045D64|nr:hypothetical protein [Rhodococcus sp. JG-3]